MREQLDNNQTSEAAEIIENILLRDNPSTLKKHLRELMDVFFMHSDHYEDKDRTEFYDSFSILTDALTEMEKLKENRN